MAVLCSDNSSIYKKKFHMLNAHMRGKSWTVGLGLSVLARLDADFHNAALTSLLILLRVMTDEELHFIINTILYKKY